MILSSFLILDKFYNNVLKHLRIYWQEEIFILQSLYIKFYVF